MRRIVALAFAACGASHGTTRDAAPDAYPGAAACASEFGSALTDAFGRIDGTLLAIVPPGDNDCAQPNSTHVTVQVTMGGAVYRMVVNVLSDSDQPGVYLDELDAPLAGPAWSDGWHTDALLDYVTTLAVTKSEFALADEGSAVARIEQALVIGEHISVFATSSGGSDAASAHLVHRNATNMDGAIVLAPDTAPHYLLTAFEEQTF
jgi:hypothetical protein